VLGDELTSRIRLGAGDRFRSPALVTDGKHPRVDDYDSLGVIAKRLAGVSSQRYDMGESMGSRPGAPLEPCAHPGLRTI
jgi:hypothetical protein